MRIGKIVNVEIHERAKKPLYKMSVDMGKELGIRTIIAGIAEQYKKEELMGMLVVCLVNLEPKIIAGIESQGMLLAAESNDRIAVLTPSESIEPGSRVR